MEVLAFIVERSPRFSSFTFLVSVISMSHTRDLHESLVDTMAYLVDVTAGLIVVEPGWAGQEEGCLYSMVALSANSGWSAA
jgi:hypothetical protein